MLENEGYHIIHMGKKKNSILWEKRIHLRLTQREVAERANITLAQYSKFESGERNIMTASFQLACRVIEALGMDPTRFFHNEYMIGEEIYIDDEGRMCYTKTGRPDNVDITADGDVSKDGM